MSKVFYRNPHQEYPRGLRGEGVYLYDTDGKQYLDGSGGAAVSCVGHLHPYVIEAIKHQIEELAYAHTAFFTNEPQERLAVHLAERFGAEGSRVYYLSGGSEPGRWSGSSARAPAHAFATPASPWLQRTGSARCRRGHRDYYGIFCNGHVNVA